MVKKLEDITDVAEEWTNRDEKGKDIILFNLMAGSCSRQCPNCYDRLMPSKNMEPETFEQYLQLVVDTAKVQGSNVSTRLSTIASRITEFLHLQQFLDSVVDHDLVTSVYASDLGTDELIHPAVDLVFFHITQRIEDEIATFKALEANGKRMHLRYNFAQEIDLRSQMDGIHRFVDLAGNDSYLLRYSISAKTRNPGSQHFTPKNFAEVKAEFFDMMNELTDMYPNMRFRSERPFFRCNFTPDELNTLVPKFGVRFYCVMEFTVDPTGVCGLCPPVTLMTSPYESRPRNPREFMHALDVMRKLTKELQDKPSFESCYDCKDPCQGGCLSYKF